MCFGMTTVLADGKVASELAGFTIEDGRGSFTLDLSGVIAGTEGVIGEMKNFLDVIHEEGPPEHQRD